MPLLKRQVFEKAPPPPDLSPDEEVFYCPLTDEIFRDYEEFFERIILCNSLVWTCSITGRTGLTYQEALESEDRARKHLATFPTYLQKPILYLASLTHRSRLNDMNDDVFVFAKDRYFVGEVVECIHKHEKKNGKVIKVIPEALDPENPEGVPSSDLQDPDEYMYVVQISGAAERVMVKGDMLSRKKGLYTRDKSKLFLKQHSEPVEGIWKIKDKHARRFKLQDCNFEDMFVGKPPNFTTSEAKKKNKKVPSGESEADRLLKKAKKEHKEKKEREKAEKKKKQKEEADIEIVKEVKKKMTPEEREALKEQFKRQKEAEKLAKIEERQAKAEEIRKKWEEEKARRKQEKDEEREKIREEKRLKAEYLKEWSRPRDDLECDDLKVLPDPTPVQTGIPSELFGDALGVLEFLHVFGSLYSIKDEFRHGVTLDMLERALLSSEVDGVFADLLGFLLVSIFNLQEEEEEEEEEIEKEEKEKNIATDIPEGGDVDMSMKALVQSATIAAQWPQLYHGTSLSKIHLDATTLSEVLRIHFMSSGAKANDSNSKFRYQQRGGYSSLDDAGLEFRRQEQNIMKKISTLNVFDLEPGEKLKILHALINQLMTYASTRDFIEENIEKAKQMRYDLKQHQWAEVRREREEAAARWKKRQEERAREKQLELERKEQKKKEKEEKLKAEEGGEGTANDSKTSEGMDVDKPAEDKPETPEKDEEKKDAAGKGKKKGGKKEKKNEEEEEMEVEEEIDESKLSPEELEALQKKRAEEEAARKKEYFEKEEEFMEAIEKLQHGSAIYPLGRDRAYRRFWVFRSLPGLFVEDHEEFVPEDLLQAVEQSTKNNPFISNNLPLSKPAKGNLEDKSTSSDKENESFDAGVEKDTTAMPVLKPETPLKSDSINSANIQNGDVKSSDEKAQDADVVPMETDTKVDSDTIPVIDISPNGLVPQNKARWCFYSKPEEIDNLIEALNPRGFREGPLKLALLEQKVKLSKEFENSDFDELLSSNYQPDEAEEGNKKQVNIKSRNRATTGAVKNSSAQEFLELNLREMLLDIEERIYAGSIGTIQVKDRLAWRDAIEQGTYDMQCDGLTWGGKTETEDKKQDGESSNTGDEKEKAEDDDKMETEAEKDAKPGDDKDEEVRHVVKDLAKALLQIAQGMEAKYLNPPLGEDEEVKKAKQKAHLEAVKKAATQEARRSKRGLKETEKQEEEDDNKSEPDTIKVTKTPLERWEESLMVSESLPQVFLHLTTLDRSIMWSKSALNARCRICRRKGDAEVMLLCDGCDRGHHMSCLKPPLKHVPTGDWFCPDCKPKVKASPRKRRRTFVSDEESEEEEEVDESDEEESDEEEESEAEESEEEEEAEESDEEQDSDEDEEEDESSEEEEDSDEEEKRPVRRGIKIGVKPASKSGRSTPSSVRSGSRQGNKKSPAQARVTTQTKGRGSPVNVSVKPRKESPATSRTKTGRDSPSVSGKGKATKDSPAGGRTSRSRGTDSPVEGRSSRGSKRKAEDDPNITPKSSLTKSRSDERFTVMKSAEQLVQEIVKHEDSGIFHVPVSKKDAPDYYQVVLHPMDLSTIRTNINTYQYNEPSEILDHLRIMIKNCEQYNMPNTPEYKAGQRLGKYVEKRIKELNLEPKQSGKQSAASSAGKRTRRN